jgi:hypothetical protein
MRTANSKVFLVTFIYISGPMETHSKILGNFDKFEAISFNCVEEFFIFRSRNVLYCVEELNRFNETSK